MSVCVFWIEYVCVCVEVYTLLIEFQDLLLIQNPFTYRSSKVINPPPPKVSLMVGIGGG
jgi:hypothetical protein